MLQLSPHETGRLPRSKSTISVAASATTYHSFHDIELFDAKPTRHLDQKSFKPNPVRRHDSGYASIPSGSQSGGSHGSGRRASTTSSSNSSSNARPRTRPSIHRATRSTPSPRTSVQTGYSPQRPRSQQQSSAYFQFPSLETPSVADEGLHDVQEPLYPPPPQTTHYWTSDHTRRLEYAAIDAASTGIKGWVLKHVVPDCFVPKHNRRLAFDDDSGSVRRYRLELEYDDHAEKRGKKGKRLSWLTGRS